MAVFHILPCFFIMLLTVQAARWKSNKFQDTYGNEDRSKKLQDMKAKSSSWTEIPEKVNLFGIELQKRIRKSIGNDQNIIFSPFSLFTAFSAVCLGAKKKTKDQMTVTLNWGDDEEFLNYILPWFKKIAKNGGNKSLLSTASRVWMKEDYNLLPKYVKDLKNYFDATFGTFDMTEPEKKINNWVLNHTHGNIHKLLPTGSVDELTRVILVNAVHFKGKWAREFKKERNRNGIFCLKGSKANCFYGRGDNNYDNTNRVRVTFMRQQASYRISYNKEATLIEMPYSGGLFSMFFIVPGVPSEINELEEKMSPKFLTDMIRSTRKQHLVLQIPKFEVQVGLDLDGDLMQMKNLFDPGNADLSGINGKMDLYVSKAVHKAKITINEEGTEASAATGIMIMSRSGTPEFILNRPFLFYLMHKPSKTILFPGKIMNPNTV